LDATFHPGLAVTRYRAEVDKFTGLVGGECQRAACAYCQDPVRACGILIYDDIVLGALAVDQVDLHGLAFMHHQHRIDLAVDFTADAQIDHPALRDPGAQREDSRRVHIPVCHRGGRRRGGGLGWSGRLRRLRQHGLR